MKIISCAAEIINKSLKRLIFGKLIFIFFLTFSLLVIYYSPEGIGDLMKYRA
jgi:hypothetical protein